MHSLKKHKTTNALSKSKKYIMLLVICLVLYIKLWICGMIANKTQCIEVKMKYTSAVIGNRIAFTNEEDPCTQSALNGPVMKNMK